jgi:hypothetical protein
VSLGRPALDTRAIYKVINDRRTSRNLTWRDVAGELGPGFSPEMLTRLACGTGTGFPRVMRIFKWLERPVAEFTRFIPDADEQGILSKEKDLAERTRIPRYRTNLIIFQSNYHHWALPSSIKSVATAMLTMYVSCESPSDT